MAGPRISDNVLLRFLDGGDALSAEQTRQALSASLARAHCAARSIGATDFLITLDHTSFVVRDDVVVTVIAEPRPACRFMAIGQDRKAYR